MRGKASRSSEFIFGKIGGKCINTICHGPAGFGNFQLRLPSEGLTWPKKFRSGSTIFGTGRAFGKALRNGFSFPVTCSKSSFTLFAVTHSFFVVFRFGFRWMGSLEPVVKLHYYLRRRYQEPVPVLRFAPAEIRSQVLRGSQHCVMFKKQAKK